ncbi:MAG: ester cyclase [Thermoanaerobaculia bacterium]
MASSFQRFFCLGLLLASTGAAFSGSAETTTPAIEANKAVVRGLFKAFNEGDVSALNQLVDPKRAFHSATMDRQGTGESRKTLGEACPMCASLNPRAITIDFMMAEGDLVTVRSTWRGKYTDVIHDVPISGKDIVVQYTNTYRIANGRIVENWAAYDRLHLLEQLGFDVAPPTAAAPAK